MDVQALIEALKQAQRAEQQAGADAALLKALQEANESRRYLARELQQLNGTLQAIRMEGLRLQK